MPDPRKSPCCKRGSPQADCGRSLREIAPPSEKPPESSVCDRSSRFWRFLRCTADFQELLKEEVALLEMKLDTRFPIASSHFGFGKESS